MTYTMKSYCVKQKNQTECVEPSGYKTAKNAECGIRKTRFAKNQGN